MKKNIAIYTHQGMGDFIICNGLFRAYAATHDLVAIPAKYPNTESVRYMLRDVPNIAVRPVEDDSEAMNFMQNIWTGETLYLICGGPHVTGPDFDQCFYRKAKVSFQLRWDGWKLERNALQEVIPPLQPFAFIHQDIKRGFYIDANKIESRIYCEPDPGLSPNVFAWIPLLLAAQEIHCIDSSFALLADSLDLKPTQKLFIHRYARPSTTIPTYRHHWTILK